MQCSFIAILLFLLSLGAGQAQASVVLNGTRVIYPGEQREKTLQLSNPDDHPNLVQVWLDRGTPGSTPETADAPFVVNPQIFRMEPHTGQMVRLMFTGEALPQDRESVFYLNFSQIPALKADEREANKLILMFSSRLKVFYRPDGLAGPPGDLAAQLTFHRTADAVQIDNPTGYHVVVRSAALLLGNGHLPLAEAQMLAPFSQARWPVRGVSEHNANARLRLILINDYGSDVTHELPLP